MVSNVGIRPPLYAEKIRKNFTGQFVTVRVEGKDLILSPLETVDQLLSDLDEAHQEWRDNGGIGLDRAG